MHCFKAQTQYMNLLLKYQLILHISHNPNSRFNSCKADQYFSKLHPAEIKVHYYHCPFPLTKTGTWFVNLHHAFLYIPWPWEYSQQMSPH